VKKDLIIDINNKSLKLTNLEKILYPGLAISKAEIIQYYLKNHEIILRFLSGRPLSFIRYPDGINGKSFFSKNKPTWAPEWVESKRFEEDDNDYVLASNQATLMWIANLAALEIHAMTINQSLDYKPDHFIFDLDPSEEITFEDLKSFSFKLKEFLESKNFTPYIKTSGGKGLHIYVPIKTQMNNKQLTTELKLLSKEFIAENPIATLALSKIKRRDKILLDIYRNHESQTCAAPWCSRAKSNAAISTPITWNHLPDVNNAQQYHIRNIDQYISEYGDPWADFYENSLVYNPSIKAKKVEIKKKQQSTIEEFEEYKSPMLADMTDKMVKDYHYEIKWDGIRIIAIITSGKVSIISRGGSDISSKFPLIVEELSFIENKYLPLILDGEIVANSLEGKMSFADTISRMHLKSKNEIAKSAVSNPTVYYYFDILMLANKDIRNQTFESRRDKLVALNIINEHLKISEIFEDGEALFEASKKLGLEGIMCKAKGSKYHSGQRTNKWLKLKHRETDIALIIGYTKGKGHRSNVFGSLHLAKKDGEHYAYKGKVGTGFNHSKVKELYKTISKIDSTPKFISDTIEEEKDTVWILPLLECNIQFASLTPNGHYREPVFLSLIE
jgi:DNA ligase D-like protein (predicted ligase)/DNA ligase D-like protein (predicted polymerase)